MIEFKPHKIGYPLLVGIILLLVSFQFVLAESPANYGLSRAKVWWSTVEGINPDRNQPLGHNGDSYPGYFGAGSHGHTSEAGGIAVVGIYKGEQVTWGMLHMNYGTALDVQDHGMRENYNFRNDGVGVAEEEVWCKGKLRGDSPQFAADVAIETRSRVWSLPQYDDFIITDFKLTNTGDEPIYNFYFIEAKGAYIPQRAPFGALDNEYVYDEKRGTFVFYDADAIQRSTGEPATYAIPPGDVTGDVGDPDNIRTVGSINFRLYAATTFGYGYVNIDPAIEPQFTILNSSGNITETDEQVVQTELMAPSFVGNTGQGNLWQHCLWMNQPNAADMTVPVEQIFRYPNPRMSYLDAVAAGEEYAGNIDERRAAMTMALGPLTFEPNQTITFTRILCYGQMDPELSMRGGLDATKMLDMDFVTATEGGEGGKEEHAAIKSWRQNWDAALELINNNYQPPQVPPPTCGIPPRVTFSSDIYPSDIGQPLDVTQYVGEMSGELEGAESGIQLTWDAVHENYTDPITGVDDFVGYYIYQSDVAIDGPWTRIATVSKEKAAANTSGGRVTMAFPVKAGVPYRYTVTSYDSDGLESGKTCYNYEPYSTKRGATNNYSKVRVVPNPFKQQSGFLDPGEYKRLTFVNIPSQCTIKIYNLAGELMRTVEHNDGTGEEAWGSNIGTGDYMLTEYFRNVMPGFYIYHITSHVSGHEGETATGKFVIIK